MLDDVGEPRSLQGWWPPSSPNGWTLVTTRRQDAAVSGGSRIKIDIEVYAPEEGRNYLHERLAQAGMPELANEGAERLCTAVGLLPLALSHAAAYMINQHVSCSEYLNRYTSGDEQIDQLMPDGAPGDGYPRAVAVTLLLALTAAEKEDRGGLARPAIRLAGMMDPAGHPEDLWFTSAVTGYLGDSRGIVGLRPVTAAQAREALLLLHRYGLITHLPRNGHRAVAIHALTARVAREDCPDLAGVTRTVADALDQLWPDKDYDVAVADLVDVLRSNTTNLLTCGATAGLWRPERHPVLVRAGESLLDADLSAAAVAYWTTLASQAKDTLGLDDPGTLFVQAYLGRAILQAGQSDDAIALLEQVAAASERVSGTDSLGTLSAWAGLAASYWQAGRTAEAIALEERVLAGRTRRLGPDDPTTIRVQLNVAASYERAGRLAEAAKLMEASGTEPRPANRCTR